MYLIDVRSHSKLLSIYQIAVRVLTFEQDLTLLSTFSVEGVDILSDENRSHAFVLLSDELLKIDNSVVGCVGLLVPRQFHKVIVPFPVGHGVLVKKGARADVCWFALTAIRLCRCLPEAIVSAERWDATGRTHSGSRQDHDFLTTSKCLSRFNRRFNLRLVLVFFFGLQSSHL